MAERAIWVRCLAEVAGTALLVGIGTGAIVAGANAGGVAQFWLALAWFFAVAVPVLLFAYVSGAHLNPAISLALALSGRLPARELPLYAGSQVAGAFAGSATVLALLGGAASLGATLPHGGNLLLIFPLEFPFTFLLVATALYLTVRGRTLPRTTLLLPALVVAVSTFVIGPWTGSSLNPARTLAPGVLSGSFNGILIYFVATFSAALLVAGLWKVYQSVSDGRTSALPHRPGDGQEAE